MVRRPAVAGSVRLAVSVATLVLAGCGEAAPVAARSGAASAASARNEELGRVTMVEIASTGGSWRVRVGDGPAARDFLAQLPLRLTLKDYARTEKIAQLPRALTTRGEPSEATPVAGDVAFYAPWGNLAIFYADGHPSPGLVRLGRIEGSPAGLAGAREVDVEIRRLPTPR